MSKKRDPDVKEACDRHDWRYVLTRVLATTETLMAYIGEAERRKPGTFDAEYLTATRARLSYWWELLARNRSGLQEPSDIPPSPVEDKSNPDRTSAE